MNKNFNDLSKDSFCREYIDLIGKLGAKQNSIYWWGTFVSSKNRFSSNLANNLSLLYPGQETAKRCDNNNAVCVKPGSNLNNSVSMVSIFTKTLISAVLFAVRTWKKIYISRKNLKETLRARIKNKSYYVIKTFVYNSSFSENGDYHDSFFGTLPEFLKRKKEVLILVDILGDYKKCVEKIRGNQRFLIVPLEYLISYADPIKAITRTFRNKVTIRQKVDFFGFDVSGIINSEIAADYKRGSPLRQHLHYICMEKLLHLIKLETFTLTYENNPWEKMCIAALRRYSPETRIVGYQHTVVPQASANMFVSRFEKNIAPLPDKILTVGGIPKKIMEHYGFYQADEIEEACALRYEYLFEISAKPRSRSGGILIALEGIYEVYNLVNYALGQLRSRTDLKVKIRTHPVLPFSRFKNKIKYNINGLPHVSFSGNTSIKEDIEVSDIVIYWGSTVALEALMIGRPVIHFDNNTILSYDPLFENSHLKWTVSEDVSLCKVIEQIYAMNDELFYSEQRKARKYLENYFYPVKEEALKKFIE